MKMEAVFAALVEEERAQFPGGAPFLFTYGTAGFRDKSDVLERLVFRVGIVAALRSKCTKATIGLVITASHNPAEDNGVKVVEPLGEMLVLQWEQIATELANVSTDDLPSVLTKIVTTSGCDFSQPARVALARDTRPSGERLVALSVRSLELMGAEYTDYGILTTPQLHYIVRCINTGGAYGIPSEEGYYKKMAAAFHSLLPKSRTGPACVKLDGANGVGAWKMKLLMEHIPEDALRVEIYNDGSGILNEKCGADYVKSHQTPPLGIHFTAGDHCASFDGDADRIVFFYKDTDEMFHLLDGDRIATLVVNFISDKLKLLQTHLSIGVVQTASANGNATRYLHDALHIPVACTATGVKYLHHKAQDFDIGVYFEANGHGTALFSSRAVETLQKASEDVKMSEVAMETAKQLYALSQLINQAVGDAISDLLLVEIILMHRGWTYEDWAATYMELPNRQLKVKVRDRMVVKTTDFERKCVNPEGLQREIDLLVTQFSKGRTFVRPSGTEDVVRVYAEADTQAAADSLAVLVGRKVHELAEGTGDPPSLPSVAV